MVWWFPWFPPWLRPRKKFEVGWDLELLPFTIVSFRTMEGRPFMSDMSESAAGLVGVVTFFKGDGVTPAKIDGDPRWSLDPSPEGIPVATMDVDPEDPFKATFKPLPIPDSVPGSAHSAQGKVEGDGDLDAGEERLVTANFVITVFRDEAQSAGVTLTPIEQGTPPPPAAPKPAPSVPIRKK